MNGSKILFLKTYRTRMTRMDADAAAPDLVQILFAALNSRDLSALEHHLTEDAGFDFPGPGLISGRKKILLFLKILFRKFNIHHATLDLNYPTCRIFHVFFLRQLIDG